MSIACQHKLVHGSQFCVSDCPATAPCGVFQYQRITNPSEIPPPDDRIIDVAVLDMNHGWPNLGHDSLVHLIQDCACDVMDALQRTGLALRALSYDVRTTGIVPEGPGGRFKIYLGTGGPGHINPYINDGTTEGSQGIQENPRWEKPVFHLFDAILRDVNSVLLSVCHSFGVMCRWSGIALPVFRGPEKGGKSTGILENLLTSQATRHPWFSHFSDRLSEKRRLRVVDNRLYDLLPVNPKPEGFTLIGTETLGIGGEPGEAMTMVEWARDAAGIMPRIFGVNHHPEIVDHARQLMILEQKHKREEVSSNWYNERLEILSKQNTDREVQKQISITSDYTIVAPLRFFLFREIRKRSAAFGFPIPFHEENILENYVGSHS